MAGFENEKVELFEKLTGFEPPFFKKRVAYFSEPKRTTHRQISQATRRNIYLSTDTQ
jgi:hypothetical protein